ncbi:MAG: hypothetical protein IJI43_00370 [Bacilli bacterium]|nr:hypothetical protein [Bacilli bacterium]
MQIEYKEKDIDKLLFTELVIAKKQNNGEVFEKEIYKRLKFCGFDDKFIKELIEYEEAILETTKKEYTKYFYQTKYWINLEENEKLLSNDINEYALYIDGKMSKHAFTTSELISIYDEADFLLNYGDNIYDEHSKEIDMLAGNSKYNLLDEFRNRISYIFHREFNREYDNDIDTFAARFFKNESHILFISKYNYAKDDSRNWTPYTKEFFKFYK